jgi:uncharacterized protein YcbK (DUF882 family)
MVQQPDPELNVTAHFKWREFASRDYPFSAEALENIPELAANLEVLRAAAGDAPITITSGYRDPRHNDAVGGASRSQHLYGRAADIRVRGFSPEQVATIIDDCIRAGLMVQGGLSPYPEDDFAHYDIRGSRARW